MEADRELWINSDKQEVIQVLIPIKTRRKSENFFSRLITDFDLDPGGYTYTFHLF